MPGPVLFDQNLLALRKRVIKHPLCSSETRDQLAKLTVSIMFHQNQAALSELIKIVNSLNKKFTAIKPTWNELAWETQRTLTSIFEDPQIEAKTKQDLLNDLYRLSLEEDEARRTTAIERIIRYCREMEPAYQVLRAVFS